mmetsp:Transcript_10485/g.43963  ORF Transcript_10485/g.43963 Transcript_10485/m.43963 type:complete len:214 (-) Transcript_10485:78-719(-)
MSTAFVPRSSLGNRARSAFSGTKSTSAVSVTSGASFATISRPSVLAKSGASKRDARVASNARSGSRNNTSPSAKASGSLDFQSAGFFGDVFGGLPNAETFEPRDAPFAPPAATDADALTSANERASSKTPPSPDLGAARAKSGAEECLAPRRYRSASSRLTTAEGGKGAAASGSFFARMSRLPASGMTPPTATRGRTALTAAATSSRESNARE